MYTLEHFEERVFFWKCPLFGDFAKIGVNALNIVCSVHNFADSAALIKKLLNVIEIAFAYVNGYGHKNFTFKEAWWSLMDTGLPRPRNGHTTVNN